MIMTTRLWNLSRIRSVLVILNKADLAQVTTAEDIKKIINCETVTISAKQETGIEELEETVKNMFLTVKLSLMKMYILQVQDIKNF